MSEGARANAVWLTCPVGHVKQWARQAVQNGAAKWCNAAGTCGQPLRGLTSDEEATCLIGGQEAVMALIAHKHAILQSTEIVTREDGMELWVCDKGHMTVFKPTSRGKLCCPRIVRNPYTWQESQGKDVCINLHCRQPTLPATRAQVSAFLIGGEAAIIVQDTGYDV